MKAGAATCLTSVLLNWYWMSKKWWTGCKIQCSTSRYTLQKIVNAHLSCYNTSVFIAIPHELLKSTFSENPLSFAESKQTLLHLSHHQQRLSQIQFLLQAAGEGLAHDVQAASQVPPPEKSQHEETAAVCSAGRLVPGKSPRGIPSTLIYEN